MLPVWQKTPAFLFDPQLDSGFRKRYIDLVSGSSYIVCRNLECAYQDAAVLHYAVKRVFSVAERVLILYIGGTLRIVLTNAENAIAGIAFPLQKTTLSLLVAITPARIRGISVDFGL